MRKVWTECDVMNGIMGGDEFATRAVKALALKQDEDELCGCRSVRRNKVGFNKFDAPILTTIAKKGVLSSKDLSEVRRRLPKYIKQLVQIANGL